MKRVKEKSNKDKKKVAGKTKKMKKDIETPWYAIFPLLVINIALILVLVINVFHPLSIKKTEIKEGNLSGNSNTSKEGTPIKSDPARGKYYISGVPYIDQNEIGYPTGCEAVSATMAARYAGYVVTTATIVENTKTDVKGKRLEPETPQEGVEQIWYGGNPFEVFVGHPSKKPSEGSYGCYANPIVKALLATGVPATDISGCSVEDLFSYIGQGKPVVVWCVKNAGDITEGITWQYEDGSGSYTELVGEHCAVLVGYDGEFVYLNDPSAGKDVSQPKDKFITNWQKLHSQALIIN